MYKYHFHCGILGTAPVKTSHAPKPCLFSSGLDVVCSDFIVWMEFFYKNTTFYWVFTCQISQNGRAHTILQPVWRFQVGCVCEMIPSAVYKGWRSNEYVYFTSLLRVFSASCPEGWYFMKQEVSAVTSPSAVVGFSLLVSDFPSIQFGSLNRFYSEH